MKTCLFSKPVDSIEELKMLRLCIDIGKSNNELILALRDYKVEIKPNGKIHKTKDNHRKRFIKYLEKENKDLKKWFIEHNKEVDEKNYKRYGYKKVRRIFN